MTRTRDVEGERDRDRERHAGPGEPNSRGIFGTGNSVWNQAKAQKSGAGCDHTTVNELNDATAFEAVLKNDYSGSICTPSAFDERRHS